ncbi:hypothetical protein ELQ35_19805 [Peribacillus cavernae]|uniref:Uncharacterized protein n=1 Tax=Peribacillus cavernae TaxID=1674310 RepID=A0A3S0W314_9BACI|nr:hypothetical protein [Peribacillus cavernae]MDQ0221062.1 2-methylcitrate dehydratase PrpD [Peribacillus cavernae]RUQ25835.1 hypothetical protein ELQ35_19805 [Peribacillus cavernae]
MNVQQKTAKFVVENAEDLITDVVMKKAKTFFLDTIGAALAGHSDRIAAILMGLFRGSRTR